MANVTGGYIYIAAEHTASPTQIATLFFQEFGRPYMSLEQGTSRVSLSLSMLVTKLQQDPTTRMDFRHHDVMITASIGADLAQFSALWCGIPEHFWYEQHPNTALMDFFAPHWMHLCEQTQATYGFFSGYELLSDDEHVRQVILPAIEHQQVAPLANYDLAYLGPALAGLWTEQDTAQVRTDTTMLRLPSGALFFRAQALPLR